MINIIYNINELHQYELVCKNWRKWIVNFPFLFHYKHCLHKTKYIENDYPYKYSQILCRQCKQCKDYNHFNPY